MQNLKRLQERTCLQNRNRITENELMAWGLGGGIGQEPGTDMYTRLCIQQTNKRPYCIAQGTLLNTP